MYVWLHIRSFRLDIAGQRQRRCPFDFRERRSRRIHHPHRRRDDARFTFANEEAAASTTPIAAAFDGTASHAANDDRDCSTPPHAAAAINDDMRLAREIRIIDRLTSVYGFPYRSALDALEECGQHLVPRDDDDEYDDDDECVVACYNWILDNRINDVGVVDSGAPGGRWFRGRTVPT